MFQRIAIVNRGEAAMRLIHAVRDLNAQAGPGGHRIETVALHTEAERSAMFVREADAAYDLGPASQRPYLDHTVLGPRLRACTGLVNAVDGRSAHEIFGSPDDMKFHSAMTLFFRAGSEDEPFRTALEKYFAGKLDPATIARL